MIRRQKDMDHRVIANCHGGTGKLECFTVLTQGDCDLGIAFMHDDVLPPGTSIGSHPHGDSEEIYFLVSGRGTMILDGQAQPFGPGDVSIVRRGHSHGLVNSDDEPMRLIVVGLR